MRVDPARAPRRPAPIREPLAVGSVVRFGGDHREARARWGVAPYYLARLHAVVRGEQHDQRQARDRRRTSKDPATVGDFGQDLSLASDDEKIYSLQWFVPLDALVAACPTANAYLGEADYPLAQVCDVCHEGRTEFAVWRPASFDSSVERGTDPDRRRTDAASGRRKQNKTRETRDDDGVDDGDDFGVDFKMAPRLYARREFAETDLDESELFHFYDDRDLDEDVGTSTRSKVVWRFAFDPHSGFAPDPKKLRRDICCKMGSVYGKCRFNNFHVAQGGGYVMCDGCGRAHHLLCVGIDPKDVPPPEGAEGGFRPNRASDEIGAVRGVRAQQHFAEEEEDGDGDGDGARRKKRRKETPWFCGESCRRKYVTKQAKLMQAQLARRKAEAEPEADPKREERAEGDPGVKREPGAVRG